MAFKKPNKLTVVGRIRTTVAKSQLLCRAKRRHSHIRERRCNAVHGEDVESCCYIHKCLRAQVTMKVRNATTSITHKRDRKARVVRKRDDDQLKVVGRVTHTRAKADGNATPPPPPPPMPALSQSLPSSPPPPPPQHPHPPARAAFAVQLPSSTRRPSRPSRSSSRKKHAASSHATCSALRSAPRAGGTA